MSLKCSVFLSLLFSLISSQTNNDLPHIIIILMDDLGYDDIGYQSHQILTPNIDYFFNNGMFLSQYYAQAVCSASRGALMTGRYPIHTTINGWIHMSDRYGLPLSEVLIPNELIKLGYQNHAIGKWHLGFYKWAYTPTFRSFNSFYGYYGGGEDYFTHISSNYYDFRYDIGYNCSVNCSKVEVSAYQNYSTYLFSEQAVNVINEYDSSKGPLFMYVAYQSVHSPADVPEKWVNMYDGIIQNSQRKKFAGMLSCADNGIGNITQALKDNNMFNNTIIIFSSDNGGPTTTGDGIGSRNYPLRGGKHSIWEGGTRVTGAFWASDNLLPNSLRNTTYTNLMHITDWMPTILDSVGVNWKNLNISFDGVSHWNNFIGNSNSAPRSNIYYGYDCPSSKGRPGNNTGYQFGGYKILNISGGWPNTWYKPVNDSYTNDTLNIKSNINLVMLYNLSSDPNEYNDISSDNMNTVQQLYNDMVTIKSTANPFPKQDHNCSSPTHPTYPIVGQVWEPWC